MTSLLSFLTFIHEDALLPCLNKQFLGVDCPGCGLQRAALLLFEGEFKAAFLMYPAIYPLILLLLFLLADQFVKIKYANLISIVLMVTTVVFILTNFLYKLL